MRAYSFIASALISPKLSGSADCSLFLRFEVGVDAEAGVNVTRWGLTGDVVFVFKFDLLRFGCDLVGPTGSFFRSTSFAILIE